MANFEAVFYEKENGREPAFEFIHKQNVRTRARIYENLKQLEEKGYSLGMPKSKRIDNNLYELRTKTPDGITRIFYFFFDGNKIILLNGFVKKTDETPPEEIDRAKRYREDYLRREKEKWKH